MTVSPTNNAKPVRRFFDEVLNAGKLDVVDEICTPDAILHAPLAGLERGPRGLKKVAGGLRMGFPDLEVAIDDLIEQDDKVVVRWHTERQTHTGFYRGIPPTGKPVRTTAIQIFRVADSKIAESWLEIDALGGARDMRVVPPEEMSMGGQALFMLAAPFRLGFLQAKHSLLRKRGAC